MKKHLSLIFLIVLFVFVVLSIRNSASSVRYEESSIQVVVTGCETGTLHPDPTYLTIATKYQMEDELTLWCLYMNLANSNGTYDYRITFDIDGVSYTINRPVCYQIGELITVSKMETYVESSLIETKYK